MHKSQKSFIYVLRKFTPTNTSIIVPVIFTVYDFVICFKALNLLRKNMLPMNLTTVCDTYYCRYRMELRLLLLDLCLICETKWP